MSCAMLRTAIEDQAHRASPVHGLTQQARRARADLQRLAGQAIVFCPCRHFLGDQKRSVRAGPSLLFSMLGAPCLLLVARVAAAAGQAAPQADFDALFDMLALALSISMIAGY